MPHRRRLPPGRRRDRRRSAPTPHQLVAMLFDGFNEAVAQARGALRDRPDRGQGQGHRPRRAHRRRRPDGRPRPARRRRLARDLTSLYGYVTLRLTQANLATTTQRSTSARSLVEPLRDAWADRRRQGRRHAAHEHRPGLPTHPDPDHELQLLNYYEAIERASDDMLEAARAGNWDEVVKLEGACAVLITQLKHAAARQAPLAGRRAPAQVAHHAAHPGQRRRDPPPRRALAGGPRRHPGRPPARPCTEIPPCPCYRFKAGASQPLETRWKPARPPWTTCRARTTTASSSSASPRRARSAPSSSSCSTARPC